MRGALYRRALHRRRGRGRRRRLRFIGQKIPCLALWRQHLRTGERTRSRGCPWRNVPRPELAHDHGPRDRRHVGCITCWQSGWRLHSGRHSLKRLRRGCRRLPLNGRVTGIPCRAALLVRAHGLHPLPNCLGHRRGGRFLRRALCRVRWRVRWKIRRRTGQRTLLRATLHRWRRSPGLGISSPGSPACRCALGADSLQTRLDGARNTKIRPIGRDIRRPRRA